MQRKHYLIAILAVLFTTSTMLGFTTARYAGLRQTVASLAWDYKHEKDPERLAQLTKAYSAYMSQQGIGAMSSRANESANISKNKNKKNTSPDTVTSSEPLGILTIKDDFVDPLEDLYNAFVSYRSTPQPFDYLSEYDNSLGGGGENADCPPDQVCDGDASNADNHDCNKVRNQDVNGNNPDNNQEGNDANSAKDANCKEDKYETCLINSGYYILIAQQQMLSAEDDSLPDAPYRENNLYQDLIDGYDKAQRDLQESCKVFKLDEWPDPRPDKESAIKPYQVCLESSGFYQLVDQFRFIGSQDMYIYIDTQRDATSVRNNNKDNAYKLYLIDSLAQYRKHLADIVSSCKPLLPPQPPQSSPGN